MRLPPLAEGGGINLHNGALHQSLGTDQLVVAGVVDNVQDAGLASARLASPGKVSSIETESTLLDVSSTDAELVDAFAAELGVAGLASQFGLSLFLGLGAFGTGVGAFMTAIATNAYRERVRLDTGKDGWKGGKGIWMPRYLPIKVDLPGSMPGHFRYIPQKWLLKASVITPP